MSQSIYYILLGGVIGYIGAVIQHFLESSRRKKSEIRQEKIKIYSKVLGDLGSLFIDKETFRTDIQNTDHEFKFALDLGRILAPARLLASNKLEEKLRDLFDNEVKWHHYLCGKSRDDEAEKALAMLTTKVRMEVEKEMKKEIT